MSVLSFARSRKRAPLPSWRWLPLALLSCGPTGGLSTLVVTALYPVHGESGLTAAMRQGILEAKLGVNFVFEEHTPSSDDEARALLDAALAPKQGRRLVITAGDVYATALDARACALNGAQVLELEGKAGPCDTLRSVQLESFTPAFLAGVLALSAESLAPRRVAGVVSAAPSQEVTSLIEGFVAGTEYVGGRTLRLELPSFDPAELDDPEAARAELAALAEAVDVLMVAGDANRELILDAVTAFNEQHPERLLRIIGVDQDLSVLNATLTLGSVVRKYHQEVRNSIVSAASDAFSAGNVVRGFSDAQSELVINPAYADTELSSVPFAGCEQCETLEEAVQKACPPRKRRPHKPQPPPSSAE